MTKPYLAQNGRLILRNGDTYEPTMQSEMDAQGNPPSEIPF